MMLRVAGIKCCQGSRIGATGTEAGHNVTVAKQSIKFLVWFSWKWSQQTAQTESEFCRLESIDIRLYHLTCLHTNFGKQSQVQFRTDFLIDDGFRVFRAVSKKGVRTHAKVSKEDNINSHNTTRIIM